MLHLCHRRGRGDRAGRTEAGGRRQAINIGVEVETSVLEFAKLMLELYGPTKSKIKFVIQEEIYGNSYEDIPRRVPDNTKMRTLLGVEPKVSLREGTALSMEWFRKEASR